MLKTSNTDSSLQAEETMLFYQIARCLGKDERIGPIFCRELQRQGGEEAPFAWRRRER